MRRNGRRRRRKDRRRPGGNDGDVLTRDSSVPTYGSAWAAPAAGGGGSGTPLTGVFRGLRLRTHFDNDKSANVVIASADEIMMQDGSRLGRWANVTADMAVAGAGGLDTGVEASSAWYQIYAIATAGSRNLLLHRARSYSKDQSQETRDAGAQLRSTAALTKIGQTFQVTAAGPLEFVDVLITRNNAPVGNVWAEIQDNAGAVLATSDKLSAARVCATNFYWARFVFRTPLTVAAATTVPP